MTVDNTIFCDVTPCSQVEVHGCFGCRCCLYVQGFLVSCVACSSALRIEVVLSVVTSVDLYPTTRNYFPANRVPIWIPSGRRPNHYYWWFVFNFNLTVSPYLPYSSFSLCSEGTNNCNVRRKLKQLQHATWIKSENWSYTSDMQLSNHSAVCKGSWPYIICRQIIL
jgi:hypothetical protein